jgi:hypothetical protein
MGTLAYCPTKAASTMFVYCQLVSDAAWSAAGVDWVVAQPVTKRAREVKHIIEIIILQDFIVLSIL